MGRGRTASPRCRAQYSFEIWKSSASIVFWFFFFLRAGRETSCSF